MSSKRSMAASASLLDEQHAAKVVALWNVLRDELDLETVLISPAPHFSYQTSRSFDLGMLERVLSDVATGARPLRIRTAGLGVFAGPRPTIYLPIVRTPELTQIHLALWSAGAMATDEPAPEYHPAAWIPHITLAQGDLTAEVLPRAVALLNGADLSWELEIDNLAIVRGRGDRPQEVLGRYPLRGGSARNF